MTLRVVRLHMVPIPLEVFRFLTARESERIEGKNAVQLMFAILPSVKHLLPHALHAVDVDVVRSEPVFEASFPDFDCSWFFVQHIDGCTHRRHS